MNYYKKGILTFTIFLEILFGVSMLVSGKFIVDYFMFPILGMIGIYLLSYIWLGIWYIHGFMWTYCRKYNLPNILWWLSSNRNLSNIYSNNLFLK